MDRSSSAPITLTWTQICADQHYRGRWVALDGCRYNNDSAQPAEGVVVDADDNLAELCNRLRKAKHRFCAVLFCDNTRCNDAASVSAPVGVFASRSARTRASQH